MKPASIIGFQFGTNLHNPANKAIRATICQYNVQIFFDQAQTFVDGQVEDTYIYAIRMLREWRKIPQPIGVLAHPAHLHRCVAVLRQMGFRVIPLRHKIPWAKDDPQWWVRNPWLWWLREIPVMIYYWYKGWI